MSQLPASGPRRIGRSGGILDVYTALAAAGLIAMGIALAILWIHGTNLATDVGASANEIPFSFVDPR